MAAYIVFTREATLNQAELDTYMQQVSPTMAGHPIKILAAYGRQEVLEGAAPEGVVIVEFPSMAEARAWYHTPEYQAVLQHRLKGAEYRAVIVESL
ncbi:MAG: DUF1330 domain-containing protein [Planctomycetia bacterium]|nr:DUF1330 domain-containing protein [Planctomycetia bacterium]